MDGQRKERVVGAPETSVSGALSLPVIVRPGALLLLLPRFPWAIGTTLSVTLDGITLDDPVLGQPVARASSAEAAGSGMAAGVVVVAAPATPLKAGMPVAVSAPAGPVVIGRSSLIEETDAWLPAADPALRLVLLRLLVRRAAGALRLAADADFAALCHDLALSLLPPADIVPVCQPGASISVWRVPQEAEGNWALLRPETIRALDPPSGTLLILSGRPRAGDVVLPPGAEATPLRFRAVPPRAPTLPAAIRAAMAGEREAVAGLVPALVRRAATAPAIGALLEEAQLLAPARPRGATEAVSAVGGMLELALSDRGGGVFLAGWLRDPLGLVARLELCSPLGSLVIPAHALFRVPRPDLADALAAAAFGTGTVRPGFLAHLPDADHPAIAQWRLALRLRSGESIDLVAPPARLAPAQARDLVLRTMRPSQLTPGLLESCIGPAAARLHAAALATPGRPEVIRFGRRPGRRPSLSIVVPLWRNLRFLRLQLAAFLRDAALAEAELVYVLDSPEQRPEVEHLFRGTAALFGDPPLTLVVMPENRGYASACNAGAAVAGGAVLALLNSDVLPDRPGWAAPLLGRLAAERRLAAVGPKLLFEDGTVQHAGMRFRLAPDGQWYNEHYAKGYARHHPEAAVPRAVPAVTGAALVVRRRAFEAVGGYSTDYIVGDFEDSDLCLALRAGGGGIGYEPGAELFHFERQSIGDHDGHARSLAAAYNRLLHHRRWNDAIGALMARFADGG